MHLSPSGPARDALRLYLNQDSRRSLRRLAEECAQKGIKASIATLKRWSTRFGWRRLAAEHDRAAAEESMARTIDYRAQILEDRFKLIDVAKQRYEWLIDPNNPNVTSAQRKRATNVTLSDFLRILTMEIDAVKTLHQLKGTKRAAPEKPRSQYTDDEMQIMMKALAEYRHRLPAGSLTKL
jgi:hypothetical protein